MRQTHTTNAIDQKKRCSVETPFLQPQDRKGARGRTLPLGIVILLVTVGFVVSLLFVSTTHILLPFVWHWTFPVVFLHVPFVSKMLVGTLTGVGGCICAYICYTVRRSQKRTSPVAASHAHSVPLQTHAIPHRQNQMHYGRVEHSLINLVSRILHLSPEQVHAKSNFFELGGDSATLEALLVALEQNFQVSLHAEALFRHPVVSQLASLIVEEQRGKRASISPQQHMGRVRHRRAIPKTAHDALHSKILTDRGKRRYKRAHTPPLRHEQHTSSTHTEESQQISEVPSRTLVQRLFSHTRHVCVTWKRVVGLIWETNPVMLIMMVLLTLLSGLIPSIQIQITSSLVQHVADAIHLKHAPEAVHQALVLGVFAACISLLSYLLSTAQSYVQSLFQMQLTQFISLKVMRKAASLDVPHFEDATFYDTLQRANQESGSRPYQILTQMLSLVSTVVTLLTVLAVLLTWNRLLGMLVVLSPLPSFVAQVFFGRRAYAIERERSPERRRLSYLQYLLTNARSVKEIRLFQLSDYFFTRYQGKLNGFYARDKRLQKQQFLVSTPFSLLTLFASAALQLYAITVTILSGNIGLLVGYMQSLSLVQSNVQAFLSGLTQLYQNNLFLRNLFELFDVVPTPIPSGTRAVPIRLRSGIEFRNVSFRYPGTNTFVLKEINLFLPAGKCVALVGHNGAGKTTLVNLLTRLYLPTSGSILLDGVPIEQYDLVALRRRIGVLYQDFVQYEMSVKENVGFGLIEDLDNEDRIAQALEKSGAEPVIRALPHGTQTVLGRMFEKGHQLSIGQWQKVALARAFMRDASLLVLDEPTSAIDAEAEATLFAQFGQLTSGATTLLIAHRFSTVRLADKIIVLEEGRVREEGTHEELMQVQDGIYARLYRLQAAGYETPQNDVKQRSELDVAEPWRHEQEAAPHVETSARVVPSAPRSYSSLETGFLTPTLKEGQSTARFQVMEALRNVIATSLGIEQEEVSDDFDILVKVADSQQLAVLLYEVQHLFGVTSQEVLSNSTCSALTTCILAKPSTVRVRSPLACRPDSYPQFTK